VSSHPNLDKVGKVVAIGGGHGLGSVMAALSFLDARLTGVVATTDNGGSTGRLRESRGGIAWGDLRNCLTQLVQVRTSPIRKLFEYRFSAADDDLEGHNLGNLIFHALDDLNDNPVTTINMLRWILGIKPRLFPMSTAPCNLACELDGQRIEGETSVDQIAYMPDRLFLTPKVKATSEAVAAIENAALILVGPGSFLTSMLPPLLVPEINQAIKNSAACKILVANIVPETIKTGVLPFYEKYSWTNKTMGIKPDFVLYPEGRIGEVRDIEEIENVAGIRIIRRCFSTTVEGLHDADILLSAIEDALLIHDQDRKN
jgi:uncharacterized cofD-like protein